MRIIAGSLRGRKLEAPPGSNTRPITDRAKETLFNILGARFGAPGVLPALNVADLFAGSGGLGIEALSRGGRWCLFAERERRAIAALRRNISAAGIGECCRLSTQNAWTMRLPAPPGEGYGLVFLDPPYKDAVDPVPVLDLLERLAPSVAPGGVVVFRHEVKTRFPVESLRALECVDERELGTMRFWFFSPPGGDSNAGGDTPTA